MTSTREHSWYEELLGAHALDALPEDEAEALEDHLATCPRCRDELSAHREVAALLAYAGTPAPAGMWDQIAAGLSPGPAGAAAPRLPELRRRPQRRLGFRTGIAAAVAAIAIGGVAGGAVLRSSVQDTHDDLVQANAQIADLKRRDEIRAAADQAAADPQARRLRVADGSGQPLADIVVSPRNRAFLVPRALQALPDGKVYQLWALVGDVPTSMGPLGRDPGNTPLSMPLPEGATGLALSVEDAPEARTPTVSAISWRGTLPPVPTR